MEQHPILLFTILPFSLASLAAIVNVYVPRRGSRNGLSHNTCGRKAFRLLVRVGLKDSFRQ